MKEVSKNVIFLTPVRGGEGGFLIWTHKELKFSGF